jgi:hypothetical protein
MGRRRNPGGPAKADIYDESRPDCQATEEVVNPISEENQVCEGEWSTTGTMVPMPLNDSFEEQEEHKAGEGEEPHGNGSDPG